MISLFFLPVRVVIIHSEVIKDFQQNHKLNNLVDILQRLMFYQQSDFNDTFLLQYSSWV